MAARGILILWLLLLFFTGESSSSSSGTIDNAMKLRMIHALYSEESPVYDSSLTNPERLRKLISLDESRQKQEQKKQEHQRANDQVSESREFLSASSWAQTPMQSGAPLGLGQYLVSISFGTPPQTLLLIADTGSDLVWLRCSTAGSSSSPQQCRHCSGSSSGPAFHTRKSSTIAPIPCTASQCFLVPAPRGHPAACRAVQPAPCAYSYDYADGSSTTGFLARDSATIAATSSSGASPIPEVAFGCGLRNTGASFSGGVGGVLALGQGELSFVHQAGPVFSHTFSYCLHDLISNGSSNTRSSFLFLGKKPDDGGGSYSSKMRFAYTPLITNPLAPTFYYVSVVAIRVANRQLAVPPTEWAIDVLGNGGTVIDSGSTLSFLRLGAYLHLINAFAAEVPRHLPRVPGSADLFQGLEVCYNASGNEVFPRLTLDFSAGLSLELPVSNYIADVADGVKCLAVRPTLSPFAFNVIGNLMQQGYHVEFDRGNSRIGFARTECTS